MEERHQALVGRRVLSPGTLLFAEGSISDRIFFIEYGVIRLEKDEDGVTVPIARLGANNIIGETALVAHRLHSLRAVAETEAGVVELSNEPFLRALKQLDPAVSVIIAAMAKKLEVATSLYAHARAEALVPRGTQAPAEEEARPDFVQQPALALAGAAAGAAETDVAARGPVRALRPEVPPTAAAHHPSAYFSFPANGDSAEIAPAAQRLERGGAKPAVRPVRTVAPPKKLKNGWKAAAVLAGGALVIYLAYITAQQVGPSEFEFRNAGLALDESQSPQGRSVKAFLQCLADRGRTVTDPRNPVTVSKQYGSAFQVKANLRSDVIFHFQLRDRPGGQVAVMERVEYLVPDRGYAQATDLEGKALFARLACE